MNAGSIGSTFNEGMMKVEGETAYCIATTCTVRLYRSENMVVNQDTEYFIDGGTPKLTLLFYFQPFL